MSELINETSRGENFRHNLLTNVSLLALLGTVCVSPNALASSDEDKPTVWIEWGGQIERLDTKQSIFAPQFYSFAKPAVLNAMVGAQRPSRYSPGLDGRISFEPKGSDWVFSATVRYGQVKNARHLHYETPGLPSFVEHLVNVTGVVVRPVKKNFGDGQSKSAASHSVLDFQVGKDVGIGLFGGHASALVSAGVRFAQFSSQSDVTLHARPVYGFGPVVPKTIVPKYHGTGRNPYRQTYTAVLHATRSTHAIGPSLSWEASMPLAGNSEHMSVAVDWGVNAAALFGRQRVQEDHNTTGNYLNHNVNVQVARHYAHATSHDRSRSVFIPNVGGFAGLSLKFTNAKFSLGYRGDFFFNATDVGIDARDAANRNFYGPFATISIGFP